MKEEFTEREILLLKNSVHERAMRLLDMLGDVAQKEYIGRSPTKKDIDALYLGHKEHLRLLNKLRTIYKVPESDQHTQSES